MGLLKVDPSFTIDSIFNFVESQDISFYFSWDKIFIRQKGNPQTFELQQKFKRQYCQGCVNYNRNVRMIDNRIFFVHENKELRVIDAKGSPRLIKNVEVFLNCVDTFTTVSKYVLTLSEGGELSKHLLSSGKLLKKRALPNVDDSKWYTSIEVFCSQVVVCSLDKNYFKRSSNTAVLLDLNFKVLDTINIDSVSTKNSRQL